MVSCGSHSRLAPALTRKQLRLFGDAAFAAVELGRGGRGDERVRAGRRRARARSARSPADEAARRVQQVDVREIVRFRVKRALNRERPAVAIAHQRRAAGHDLEAELELRATSPSRARAGRQRRPGPRPTATERSFARELHRQLPGDEHDAALGARHGVLRSPAG